VRQPLHGPKRSGTTLIFVAINLEVQWIRDCGDAVNRGDDRPVADISASPGPRQVPNPFVRPTIKKPALESDVTCSFAGPVTVTVKLSPIFIFGLILGLELLV
jgi:hypothetical protein